MSREFNYFSKSGNYLKRTGTKEHSLFSLNNRVNFRITELKNADKNFISRFVSH